MAWTPVIDGQTPNWSVGVSFGQALDSVFGFGAFCATPIAGGLISAGAPWTNVNDAQNPGWTPASDGQTPNWTNVNDAQSPNWVNVPT